MIGETVVVEVREQVGVDAHRVPVYEWVTTPVDGVLVAPGPRVDVPESGRPVGTVVAWNLHFPKVFTGSLRGARVRVRGGAPCDVIGDPQPYTPENTPTRWWLPVEVSRADG